MSEQHTLHIVEAVENKKVRVKFQGMGRYDRIGVKVERLGSFSEPLRVIIPAGTCIIPETGNPIEFPSLVLPHASLVRFPFSPGGVVKERGLGVDSKYSEPSPDKGSVELKAVCLERWGATPSPEYGSGYSIAPPIDSDTDLGKAASRMHENEAFQLLSDEERHNTLQYLVWLVNDRWLGWQASPYRDLIVDAVQPTALASELDYEYVIQIGEYAFANCWCLDGFPFPADMFRIRNHLRAGEMVVMISETGLVAAAHATEEQRVLTIIDPSLDRDGLTQRPYLGLAQAMKGYADIEVEEVCLRQEYEEIAMRENSGIQTADDRRNLSRIASQAAAIESKKQVVKLELIAAFKSYSESAAPALAKMVMRHQVQASRLADVDGCVPPNALRGPSRLIKRCRGDWALLEAESSLVADLARPAQLVGQIRRRAGPLPTAVLVKVSKALSPLHLQAAYDCCGQAGIEDFKEQVEFVVLVTE